LHRRRLARSLAISLFVTIPVIYSGFKGVEVNQFKLARTFGASNAQILTKVILPSSIPTMIAALKVNAGLWRHRPGREVRHAPAMACCR
jgi:ABC-type nitrate/sulfonate/bicarbonate transport system permease component